jgi:hypothetical protein
MKLPTVHDGHEQRSVEAQWRSVLQVTNPALLRALDARAAKLAAHAIWQSRVNEQAAVADAAKTKLYGTPPDVPGLRREREQILRDAEDELREIREECLAALEEAQQADQRVQSLNGIAS